MTEIEAIRSRHSVRSYSEKKIEAEKQEILEKKIEELNAAGGLHLQFLPDAAGTFTRLLNKFMGLGSAPSVIACAGKEAEDLEERIGYYGEQLVLLAQQLGLNTCWAGTFKAAKVPAQILPGEKLVIVIAIGYGLTQGSVRKSKTPEQVSVSAGTRPAWFDAGVEMALLAPTAINQQRFEIALAEDGSVSFKDKGGLFSKVDLGIVKYHFEAGAEAKKKETR